MHCICLITIGLFFKEQQEMRNMVLIEFHLWHAPPPHPFQVFSSSTTELLHLVFRYFFGDVPGFEDWISNLIFPRNIFPCTTDLLD